MKETARLIVTYDCDRNCPGCCNKSGLVNAREIYSVNALGGHKEVVITGGEPFLYPRKLLKFIKQLKKANRNCKVYIYTACLHLEDYDKILNLVDGITVTLHAEATNEDIRSLKYMSEHLWGEMIDMRLFIDTRVYDRYDLRNIRLQTWDVVRKLEWKEDCKPADNEELLYLQI